MSVSDRRLWLFACCRVPAVALGAEPAAGSPGWCHQWVARDTPVSLLHETCCLPKIHTKKHLHLSFFPSLLNLVLCGSWFKMMRWDYLQKRVKYVCHQFLGILSILGTHFHWPSVVKQMFVPCFCVSTDVPQVPVGLRYCGTVVLCRSVNIVVFSDMKHNNKLTNKVTFQLYNASVILSYRNAFVHQKDVLCSLKINECFVE